MNKFFVLLALCATCFAAPAPEDIKPGGLTRPSPINPAVLSDPRPADKVVLIEGEQKRQTRENAPPAPQESLRSPVTKPASVVAYETLQHNPPKTQKRDTLASSNQKELPKGVPATAPAVAAPEKPARALPGVSETLQNNPKRTLPTQPPPRQRRDIPVPTVIKTTTPKVEETTKAIETTNAAKSSSTEHPAIRHHPVPVAELFSKAKHDGSSSSSQEKDTEEEKA